jgi:TRAP-type C4-dicarboxylate transport system permease small subunit
MSDISAETREEFRSPFVESLSRVIALLGGVIAICMATLIFVSVLGRWLFGSPINGDFELMQMGTAVCVFSFLPLCQARRGNIVVDTFTSRLSPRVVDAIDSFWDLVYAGVMALFAYALMIGAIEHLRNGQTTMMLQLIIWPAIFICALLCGVLALVAFITGLALFRGRS